MRGYIPGKLVCSWWSCCCFGEGLCSSRSCSLGSVSQPSCGWHELVHQHPRRSQLPARQGATVIEGGLLSDWVPALQFPWSIRTIGYVASLIVAARSHPAGLRHRRRLVALRRSQQLNYEGCASGVVRYSIPLPLAALDKIYVVLSSSWPCVHSASRQRRASRRSRFFSSDLHATSKKSSSSILTSPHAL